MIIIKKKLILISLFSLIITTFLMVHLFKPSINKPNHEIEWYKEYYEQYVNNLSYTYVDTPDDYFPRYKVYQKEFPQINSWMRISSIDRLLENNYEFEDLRIDDIYQFNSSINNLRVGKQLYAEIIDEIISLLPKNTKFIINLEIRNLYRNNPIVEDNPEAIQKYLSSPDFNGYVIIRILLNRSEKDLDDSISKIESNIIELMKIKWKQYSRLEKVLYFGFSSNINLYNELTLDKYFDENNK